MQSGIYSYPATSRIVYRTDFVKALTGELDLAGDGAPTAGRRVVALLRSEP